MTDDPNRPEVLVSLATEAEAASIVTALAERDIEAFTTGSSSFPGSLGLGGGTQVMVKHSDLDQAKRVLAEMSEELKDID